MSLDRPARPRTGRHAADEPEARPAPPRTPWWRRLFSHAVVVAGGQVVVHVRGDLDDVGAARLLEHLRADRGLQQQVVVVHLEECGFVNARGFRALLLLQEQVALQSGRLLVLDPPRTLRIMCEGVPDRLILVPSAPTSGRWSCVGR